MKTRRFSAYQRLGIQLLSIWTIGGFFCCLPAQGQEPVPILNPPPAKQPKHAKAKQTPQEASVFKPVVSIPVAPLGFAPPAVFYLGYRLAQVSLNFLDENELLFTFRVPGLIAREHPAPGQAPLSDQTQEERNIRALVLALPSGKVTAEALWRLHDFAPYLWVLKDHRFLLRDRNLIQTGDAALHMEPFLRFPGMVKHIQLDPEQQLLVAETVEQPAPDPDNHAEADSQANEAGSVLAAGAASAPATPKAEPENQSLIRIVRMRDRKVMLFGRIENEVVNVPVDGDGYYDAVRGNGLKWLVRYRDFTGEATPVLQVDSTCSPTLDVLAPALVLASACTDSGGRTLIALTRDRRRLWDVPVPATRVWPILVKAAESPRMARATLDVPHPVSPSNPLDPSDIRGQTIQVYDLATGKVVLGGPASPILDGGGGFALSPSGTRLAVLNEGAIQVYDLPPVPPLPAPSTESPGASHP